MSHSKFFKFSKHFKSILVPYHGWRISHRNHHMKHNHIHKDKTFIPLSKQEVEALPAYSRFVRFSYLLLVMFPLYLTLTFDSTEGNHFNPWNNRLFKTTTEFYQGLSSAILNITWITFLFYKFPFLTVVDAYLIPVIIFGMWLVMVTFLHHTDDKGDFFDEENWTFLKGAETTFDRNYGYIIEDLHHNIGTHVVHHLLFTKIPHYHLVEATQEAKKVLGDFYKEDKTPFWQAFHKSLRNCIYIEKEGDVYKYKKE